MSARLGAMLHVDPSEDAATTSTGDAHVDGPPPVTTERRIREGDLVIVVEGFASSTHARITKGGKYSSKFGTFYHDDWIGGRFGARVRAREGRGFVWLCAPTPELWTKVLEHRTQILYAPDIALVCAEMELKPGSVIVESGTGSGSLTHALARCVAPHGRVWTYEFNETRATMAKEEFAENGIDTCVTVTHRDIERNGFPEELRGCADAAFLDLPGPYKCVKSVSETLRPDGVLCSFSPCIEQVHKTIAEMNKHGFIDIKTVELLGREYDVQAKLLQTDFSQPLAKAAKVGWRKEHKRPRDGKSETDAAEQTGGIETIMTHPRQRLQSHTSYLTFARLVPTPEGWERTLEEREAKKKSVSADVLERAAEFLKRRRKEGEHARERGQQQQQQKSRARANAYSNADEYSD